MKHKAALVSVLIWCLLGFSCQNSSREPVEPVGSAENPHSGILTLSEQQLVGLDWHSPKRAGVRVTEKRIVTGAGVEYDILFPNNEPGMRSLNFVSSGEGGIGALVGANIRGYETYALKVTLVSVNRQSDPDMLQKVVVGALIGLTATGKHSNYDPYNLGFAESEKTVIARTPVETNKISQIGFHIHILNPEEWGPARNTVTLRIEPVEDGGQIPWRVDR